jgi:hypothetical protein
MAATSVHLSQLLQMELEQLQMSAFLVQQPARSVAAIFGVWASALGQIAQLQPQRGSN